MAFTQIHHTSVLAWSHQDAGPFGGKTAEQWPGVAVAAMLRPHHPEHAQFSPIGITAQATLNLPVIVVRQSLLAESGGHIKRLGRFKGLGHGEGEQLLPVLPTAVSDPGVGIEILLTIRIKGRLSA